MNKTLKLTSVAMLTAYLIPLRLRGLGYAVFTYPPRVCRPLIRAAARFHSIHFLLTSYLTPVASAASFKVHVRVNFPLPALK